LDDAQVGGELLAAPEHQDDPIGLKERRVLDVEGGSPSQRLIERLRTCVVGYAQGDQGDARPHGALREARRGRTSAIVNNSARAASRSARVLALDRKSVV